MTLYEIRDLVLSADPGAEHYASAAKQMDFTVWAETQRAEDTADGWHDKAWKFTVTRVTRTEFDPVAAAIEETLDEDDRVAYQYKVSFNIDEGGVVIIHTFECEG